MSTLGGSSIVTSGLVLHLDVPNTRSFKGEPTINLLPDPLFLNSPINTNYDSSNGGWGSSFRNKVIIGILPDLSIGRIYTQELLSTTSAYNIEGGQYEISPNTIPLISGRTYTISLWVKSSTNRSTTNLIYLTGAETISDGSRDITTEWQKITKTITPTVTGNFYIRHYFYGVGSIGFKVFFTTPQIEEKSYSTPFVVGTRGTTVATGGGLADLSGNNNHGELVDGPTYSSSNNGSIVFDGVDDKVQTTYSPNFGDFSVCLVFKDNGSAAWGRLVDKSYSTGFFISSYFASSGVNYVGAGILEPNPPHGIALPYEPGKYHFFASVRNGTTHTIYLDGITQTNTKTVSSGLLDSTAIAIGRWSTSSTQPFKGLLPYVSIYNKALTPQEVLQNYNATKLRYNL